MPINDVAALRQSVLARVKTGGVLSDNDVNKLVAEVKKDGVTAEEVHATVAALVEAMQTGWDPAQGTQTKRLEKLLGQLHAARPDAVDVRAHTQAGKVNWLAFVVARASAPPTPGPVPPGPVTPGPVTPPITPPVTPPGPTLPTATTGFAGQAIAVTADGGLVANGSALSLALKGADSDTRAALTSLAKPDALKSVDAAAQGKLASALTSSIATALPVAQDGTNKFETAAAVFGALGALDGIAARLGSADVDALLASVTKLPSPAAQALAMRVLASAPKSDAQKATLAALPAVADGAVLLAAFDEARSGAMQVGSTWSGSKLDGEAAAAALTALSFAKNAGAVDSIKKGIEEYAKISSPTDTTVDATEARAIQAFLAPYVNNAGSSQLVFGAFLQDAPKEVAKHTNARVVAQVAPLLEGAAPKIGGVPLTIEQATFVKTMLPGIKDEAAVQALAKGLADANAAFSTTITNWGTTPPTTKPLPPVAFAAFERVAVGARDGAKDTKDGMIDMSSLARAAEGEARAIADTVVPHLRTLAQTPPRMGAVTVSPALAQELQSLLMNRARSTLSAPNLEGGLAVVAAKNGGKVEGAAADAFVGILREYVATFPNSTMLDFNKLGRITTFRIEGKQVPLCTLNGQPVPLGDFYTKVAGAVSASIDRSVLRHAWMADRFGWRAKMSTELLDVVAQKASEQAGPIHVLKQKFPGANIEVLATAKDGDHERFLYRVAGQGVFCEQSDGLVTKYDDRLRSVDPVLFTANVREDGSFDVAVPTSPRKINKYPMQTPFSVGDSVDVQFMDNAATERAEEGKPFDTRYKIVHGTIQSFDAAGNYTVAFKDPQGRDQTKAFSIDALKKQNTPHFFAENASHFSDVGININTDAKLKTFLEGADPIIKKHLPTDGTLLGLSQSDLVKRQKQCVDELMQYTHDLVKYPADKSASPDDSSRRYHEMIGGGFGRVDLGKLVEINRGVCRHQCILEHLLLQRAGIDSRLASGAANTYGGEFRGFHIWVELSLADNARYLSDQTWDDATIPLWEGAYGTDKRRVEMYDRTSRYDYSLTD